MMSVRIRSKHDIFNWMEEIMIGKRNGSVVIIKYVKSIKKKGRIFLCKCDCGKEIEKTVRNFNRSYSCGCVVGGGIKDKRTIDMAGKKINALTVLGVAEKSEVLQTNVNIKSEVYWKCKCDCGKEIFVRGCDLRKERIKSCNCLRPELIAEIMRKYHPRESSARSIFSGKYSDGDLTFDEFLELTQKNCYYCDSFPKNKANVFGYKFAGNKKSTKFSIDNGNFVYNGLDRIDPNLPHNKDNVVPCCIQCNVSKLNYSIDDFKIWINRVYSYFILNKRSYRKNKQLKFSSSKEIYKNALNSNPNKISQNQIGKIGSKTNNLIGLKFNMWSVISPAKKPIESTAKKKGSYWVCSCSCGNEKILYSRDFISGRTKSCGCLKVGQTAKRFRKYHPAETSARSVYRNYNDGDISISEFMELTQQNCHYCGVGPSNNFNFFKNKKDAVPFSIENGNFNYNGLDRVDSTKGHYKDNVVPSCWKCNTSKLDYTIDEFRAWIIKLYNNFIKRS